MPSPNLNAKIVINSASPNDLTNTSWDVACSVTDLEGNFSGNDLLVNDVLFLDTSTEFPGTITRYKITNVSSQNFTDVSCTIVFDDDNTTKPDLGYVIGIDGIVLRPAQYGYNLIPDPSSQLVPNKFSVFPLNNNWKNVADFLSIIGSYNQNKSIITEIDEKISSLQIDDLIFISQQEYDAISQKNSRTIYLLEESLSPTPTPTLTPTLTPTPTLTTPTPTPTLTPTPTETLISIVNLTITEGKNSVSGYGITFSGPSVSVVSFENTFIINNYVDIVEIKIYINDVYVYRITTFSDVISSNNSFTIITPSNNQYTSTFGSGNNLGSYIRIDF